jgi:O-antigen/teichoic acid export membrane protein
VAGADRAVAAPDPDASAGTRELGTGVRVAKNSAALFVVALLSKGGGLVVAVLVARYLGPAALGTYAVVMGIALLLEQVAPIGLPIVVLRAVAKDRQRLMAYWVNASLMAFVSASVLGIALVVAVQLIGYDPQVSTSVYFVALYLPLAGLSAIAQAAVQGLEQMEHLTWSAFVGRALSLLALWLLLEGGVGVEAAFASYVVFHLVATLVLVYLMLRQVGWSTAMRQLRPELDLCKSTLRISAPFALQALLINASLRLNAAILSLFVAIKTVGMFDAADRIRDTGASIIPIVNLAILPTLSRTFTTNRGTAVTLSEKALKLLLVAILPFVFVVAIAAGQIIPLLYGPGYEAAVPVLQIVIWSQVFFVADAILNQVMIATGNERAMVRRTALALGANALLIFLLAPRLGAVGAAWAVVLSTALKLAANAQFVGRHIAKFSLRDPVAKPLLCAVLSGVIGFGLRNQPLFVMLPLFLGAYAALLLILRVFTHEEMRLLRHLSARLSRRLCAPLAGRGPRGMHSDER